ncbi:hypothetical protein DCAR_0935412 [Daucus carota subsp. sativus]|uniref:Uncharacterized protein n=1 Tax=Daucus carota subsp. sativus TaxID=79200 RepID=A0A175YHC1_DAUCS|nr:PREDICTED: uncharacterized protein LOC108203091 [Daucus carota subsp. sativus]XP_017227308.1 PREDICTED: uncharacterized protein LOC108203091 [Daucus carota subsp. sativus]WOH15866.1 hypothetical protein DCAR_0935412 [Daucus carota subsp. sativus]
MGVDKQGSKTGGGYVGGFLHLFDWNTKSRKKLFASKSDPPERLKQKKRDDGNYLTTQLHLMDQDDSLAGSSFKGSSDYSCASSVTDDDIGGSKAPGVVAKLMGLDSLPTSNFSEAYSTPFFDSRSLKDSYYHKRSEEFNDNHPIMHSGNMFNRTQEPLRNNIDSKQQKTVSSPFKKFQTEVLPPKSAKSIPLTHHKLLSPIKSGGFHPSKNAVHIMEAAARRIESGSQVISKAKMPPVGSSVPLKVRDLKERAEAARRPLKLAETSQKPAESIAVKNIKGQSTDKNLNRSLDTKTFIASSDLAESSVGSRNKGKSVSLALQAKVNVQKRGLTPNCNRNSVGLKEQGEVTSNQIFKSQPSVQRSSHKKSHTSNPPSVLRQNNQKQNCSTEREKVASKSLPYNNIQGKKVISGDSSVGRQRSSSKNSGNSKVGSRKIGREIIDDGKDLPYSSTSVTRKKRCIDGDFNFQKDRAVVDNENNGKATQSDGVMDSKFSWAEDSKRNGMDVISFTFTAPMGRSLPVPETSRDVLEKNNAFSADFEGKKVFFNSGGTNGLRSSSVGCNVIEGDALSALLEQKLRELSLRVESSGHKTGEAGSSASSFQDQTPLKTVAKPTKLHVEGSKRGSWTDSLDEQQSPVFSSTTYEKGRISKHKLQDVEDMFDCGISSSEARKMLSCRNPSPVSILEPSIFAESCNSTDTGDSFSIEGLVSSKQCSSSVQGQDVYDIRCSKKFHVIETDAELSDSASSSSTRVVATKHANIAVIDAVRPVKWELEYVKTILCNTETMFKDVSAGRTSEIIDPRLFDQLETQKGELCLQRKVIFDCVGECMDLRFRKYVGGGYKAWEKGLSMARREDWLAEEIHREISSWEAMGDCMVDELVDKDMSSQCGRWLDFSVEASELGAEIERRILNSLLNEVISDILVL